VNDHGSEHDGDNRYCRFKGASPKPRHARFKKLAWRIAANIAKLLVLLRAQRRYRQKGRPRTRNRRSISGNAKCDTRGCRSNTRNAQAQPSQYCIERNAWGPSQSPETHSNCPFQIGKTESISRAIKGLPKITELIATVPEEKRFIAWSAARCSYLQTAQALGYDQSDPARKPRHFRDPKACHTSPSKLLNPIGG